MGRPMFFQTRRAPWKPPTRSGYTTSTSGEVISDGLLDIRDTAITVNHNNVTIRNCKILYNGSNAGDAYGIYALARSGLTVEDCEIINVGAPARGELARATNSCIRYENGSDLTITRVTTRRGSNGLQIINTANTAIDHFENHDARGPFPRGMAIQWASCTGTHLAEDLSDESIPGTSKNEDHFSVFNTPNATLRRVKIPMGTDGVSGRGFVMESALAQGLVLDEFECENMYNGAVSIGLNGADDFTVTGFRTRGINRYGVYGYAGSTSSNSFPPLTFSVTGTSPASIEAKYYDRGWPGSPAWNLKTIGGTTVDNITENDWTPSLSVVRNAFEWRDSKSVPRLDLVPRIGSYWLDGRIGTSLVAGTSVLGLLPGRYISDPTSRAWQWRKNGTPVSGATGINYVLVSGDAGAVIDCVETPANSNGAGAATATAAVSVPA